MAIELVAGLTGESTGGSTDGPVLTRQDLAKIRRKRLICKLNGHLYYAERYDDRTGEAVLECRRCWPHVDSILRGYLYDLMPRVEV